MVGQEGVIVFIAKRQKPVYIAVTPAFIILCGTYCVMRSKHGRMTTRP